MSVSKQDFPKINPSDARLYSNARGFYRTYYINNILNK